MKQKFDYQDLVRRGFEIHTPIDSVYFNQHGYHPVYLTKEVAPGIKFEWDHETRYLVLSRLTDDASYLAKMPILSLLQLDTLTVFFTQTREEYLAKKEPPAKYDPAYYA